MYTPGKEIAITQHATKRMTRRGATVEEVEDTVRTAKWKPAEGRKQHARKEFAFGRVSPANGQFYRFKAVDAFFADEPDAVVVVTVLVFFYN